jgi:hypothetical protein
MDLQPDRLDQARQKLQEAAREFYLAGGTSHELTLATYVNKVLQGDEHKRHKVRMHDRKQDGVVVRK